ncbi:hypothetical protein CSUI_000440 [Cystoisospora suis]|uniref:Uncharacterized protein n=1 Tax=Cystoisospora suis TaxID=483139 RepID=A0A2C6LE14_9APIC|nr:hypothetical protein CSUI_000440 [Cystoisospora suis]
MRSVVGVQNSPSAGNGDDCDRNSTVTSARVVRASGLTDGEMVREFCGRKYKIQSCTIQAAKSAVPRRFQITVITESSKAPASCVRRAEHGP